MTVTVPPTVEDPRLRALATRAAEATGAAHVRLWLAPPVGVPLMAAADSRCRQAHPAMAAPPAGRTELEDLDGSPFAAALRAAGHCAALVWPVPGPEGVLLGELWVLDDEARPWTAPQREALAGVVEQAALLAEIASTRAELAAAKAHHEAGHSFSDGVLDTVGVAILAADADGRPVFANKACRQLFGVSAESAGLPRMSGYQLFRPDGVTPLPPHEWPLAVALREGAVAAVEVVVVTEGIAPRTVRCDGRALTAPDGRRTGVVVSLTDVSASQETVRALQESEARFRSAFVHGPAATARMAQDGLVLEVNAALRRLLARPSKDLVGRPLTTVVADADRDRVLTAISEALSGPVDEGQSTSEVQMLRRDGSALWCELTINATGGALLVQVVDVDARVRSGRALQRAASRDALTGLLNRAALLTVLGDLLDQVDKGLLDEVGLLFCDLNGFKAVNDTAGHDAGDAILQVVAERLRACLRAEDTVARYGGDEFVILSPRTRGDLRWNIDGLAGRLRSIFEQPMSSPVGLHNVGVSIGVARSGAGGNAASMLAEADAAMYHDKTGSRGRSASLDLHRLSALREALESGTGMRVVYQPVVDLHTGQVVGVEALSRLVLPTGEEVSPEEFIPIAEREGQIHALGERVVAQALVQASRWKALLGPDCPFAVGVNVSPRQLDDRDLPLRFAAALDASGLDPAAVVLELTEGVLLDSHPAGREVLGRLQALGVRISADDFGSGYSSVQYLLTYPLDGLKIDRRFAGALDEERARMLVSGLVRLAESMEVLLVMEGIETEKQLHQLRDLGVRLGQGFHLAYPLEAEEVTALLQGSLPSGRLLLP